MAPPRALFIVNPAAHNFPGWRRLQEAVIPLQQAGWQVVNVLAEGVSDLALRMGQPHGQSDEGVALSLL